MAIKKFDKDTAERQMFVDYWDLCQKCWIPENNDDYWKNIIKQGDDFCKKHSKIQLAVRLVVALIETKEAEMRGG